MERVRIAVPFLLLGLVGCRDTTTFRAPFDGGLACGAHERIIDGACTFVCVRDTDCAVGQRCNLFAGTCEAKPPAPDAGPGGFPCTNGAGRCSADAKSVETCGPDGTWATAQTCAPPYGYCLNEKCLACQPGAAVCDSANTHVSKVCLDDGSGFRTITCSGTLTCTDGECRECPPDQVRCSSDGKSVVVCSRTTDETGLWRWTFDGDAFDGSCITQVCEGTPAHCRTPACFPGTTQCKNTTVQQVCSDRGAWADVACAALPGYGPASQCQNGVCFDECADAAKAKSYFGCDYWTAVLDNVVDVAFKGGTSSGQGLTDSDFAFVVANRSVQPSTVKINRYKGGAVQTVKTVTVPGRLDAATKGLAVIYVPWQSVGTTATDSTISGLQRYAYRIQSSTPVTVYQFNPLPAMKTVSGAPTYSYTNDASLLLPAHILGTAYVGMAPEHVIRRTGSESGTPSISFNGSLTIVGTEDGTQVTVKASARTLGGSGVSALTAGGSQTFTINSYDVLQIASDNPANVASGSTTGNLECKDDPYQDPFTCQILGCDKFCRVDSDLTGTVVTTDKPVAVFGGSSCTLRGYADVACDHVEEQLFPFVTWGKTFAALRTAPLRLTNNSFASATNAGPDYYKIVAGCPASTCSSGTTLTITPTPAQADVLSPNRCVAGTALWSAPPNNCRLMGGQFVEFRSKTSFTVTANQPISVGQFFAGENATTFTDTVGQTDAPAQGDPSFILLPPVEQWRSSYTVLTAPGIRDNYIAIVYDNAKVQSVKVDGVAVAPTTTIGGYKAVNAAVSVGTHTVDVVPKAGISPPPGAGVTVYGFDSYVSYGYTGGLDLGAIVTGINPGG